MDASDGFEVPERTAALELGAHGRVIDGPGKAAQAQRSATAAAQELKWPARVRPHLSRRGSSVVNPPEGGVMTGVIVAVADGDVTRSAGSPSCPCRSPPFPLYG